MWPSPCPASSGRKARIPWTTPHRLTPSTHSQAEIGPNHGSASEATPALLHTTCTAPKRSTAAAARALTADSSLTSVGTASVSAPKPAICRSASCNACCSTSARTTLSPVRAKRRASAKPIPLAAPVTTATFPAAGSMAASSVEEKVANVTERREGHQWHNRSVTAARQPQSLVGRTVERGDGDGEEPDRLALAENARARSAIVRAAQPAAAFRLPGRYLDERSRQQTGWRLVVCLRCAILHELGRITIGEPAVFVNAERIPVPPLRLHHAILRLLTLGARRAPC